MVEVDAVDAVVAALVRPGRVLGAGPQPHPRPGSPSAARAASSASSTACRAARSRRPSARPSPGVTHLSGLDGRDDLIAALHDAMLPPRQAHPAEAARPGRARTTLSGLLDGEYGVQRLWYKATEIVVGGVPWIIEVAVADTVKPGRTWFACNHAPVVRRPAGPRGARRGRHLRHRRGVVPHGRRRGHRAAAAEPRRRRPRHLRRTAVRGQGQGRARRPASRRGPARRRRWTGPPRRCGRRPSSGARTPARPSGPSSGHATRPHAGSGRTSGPSRTPSSRCCRRPRRLPVTSSPSAPCSTRCARWSRSTPTRSWTTSTSRRRCCPSTSATIAPLAGLYYEARGELHHPHDDTVTPLGTREVEDYKLPPWQFDKVLYIEKTGLAGPARALPARPEVRHGHHLREGLRGRPRAGICWRAPSSAT